MLNRTLLVAIPLLLLSTAISARYTFSGKARSAGKNYHLSSPCMVLEPSKKRVMLHFFTASLSGDQQKALEAGGPLPKKPTVQIALYGRSGVPTDYAQVRRVDVWVRPDRNFTLSAPEFKKKVDLVKLTSNSIELELDTDFESDLHGLTQLRLKLLYFRREK